nr:hypothetical protein [Tanacetum cinerariifolium]
MDTMKAQQIALDDAQVASANHLNIGKYNQIYIQEFWATVSTHHHSLHFKLNSRIHTLNVENFIDMLHICPRLPGRRFEDPPLEEEILSFIRDLRHTREIKTIGLDSLRLSHAQILWGMYHKKNVDYVFLLWEDMDIHVYGSILHVELTNQEVLDFKAYKEYYVIASGAEPPKSKTKYKKKTDESVTSPKSKTNSASKSTRLKSKAKLATKRSKKDFHISLASSSGDGVDTQSKVPDEQVQKTYGTDEGTRTIPRVLYVPPYESEKNLDDEETMDDEVFKELYEDVNVNLEKGDAEMTDANQGGSEQHNVSQESEFEQEEEDAYVTLTLVSDAKKADEPVQSSSVSFDFTSKFLNLKNPSPADNEIASLMETSAPHATVIPELTSSFTTTTLPLPSFFNPLSCFQDKRSSECGCTTANKQAQRRNLSRESRLPQLVESYNSDKDILTSYGDVVLLKRGQDDQDKDKDLSARSDRGTKRRKSGKDAESSKDLRSKEKKSSGTSKEASQSQHKTSGKSVHAEEPSPTTKELGMLQDQGFVIGDNKEQPVNKEVSKSDWFKKPERPPTPDPD